MPIDDELELFSHVDKGDRVLGAISRKEAHSGSKKIHRSVGIFLLSDSKGMFFQQRSSRKDVDPGKWSYSVGGHVTYGETYLEATNRELQEEIGIDRANSIVELGKFLIETDREREFTTFFKLIVPESVILKFDREEISQTKWVPLNEIARFTSNHPFSSWGTIALKLTGFI